jgi:hypothetical protein
MGKPQPNISRIEDPDYGKLSLQTLFELASAFKLPLFIDMPEWDEWFRMMRDMSNRNLQRREFDVEHLMALSSNVAPPGANVKPVPIFLGLQNNVLVGQVFAGTFLDQFRTATYVSVGTNIGGGALNSPPNLGNTNPTTFDMAGMARRQQEQGTLSPPRQLRVA